MIKKLLNKSERRKERREKNKQNQEKYINSQISQGKLMWENTNGQDFSPEWINSQLPNLVEGIEKGVSKSQKELMGWIMSKKELIRDIILYWPDDLLKSYEYYLLKFTIEAYWDNRWEINNIISEYINYYRAKKEENTEGLSES